MLLLFVWDFGNAAVVGIDTLFFGLDPNGMSHAPFYFLGLAYLITYYIPRIFVFVSDDIINILTD